MRIQVLHKINVKCACGCGDIPRLDLVNKINGKYFKLYCGKIYMLHVGSLRWIRGAYGKQ